MSVSLFTRSTRPAELIGKGAYSEVYREQTDAGVRALKLVHADIKYCIHEILIVFRLHAQNHHANIVHVYNFKLSNNESRIIMDYYACSVYEIICTPRIFFRSGISATLAHVRDMFDTCVNDAQPDLPILKPECMMHILIGVVNGLSYMHHVGIIHGDIKPQNIMLNIDNTGKITPVIIDFNISQVRTYSSCNQQMLVQTPMYRAPEMYINVHSTDTNDQEVHNYNFRIDIWSLGVIAYEMLTHRYISRTDIDTPVIVNISKHMFIDQKSVFELAITAYSQSRTDVNMQHYMIYQYLKNAQSRKVDIRELFNIFIRRSLEISGLRNTNVRAKYATVVEFILDCLTIDPLRRPSAKWLLVKYNSDDVTRGCPSERIIVDPFENSINPPEYGDDGRISCSVEDSDGTVYEIDMSPDTVFYMQIFNEFLQTDIGIDKHETHSLVMYIAVCFTDDECESLLFQHVISDIPDYGGKITIILRHICRAMSAKK